MEILFPDAAKDTIVRYAPELWYPNRNIFRTRSGSVREYNPVAPLYRGTVSFGKTGHGQTAKRDAIDAFINEMAYSTTNWTWMPWGGDPPYYPTPSSFVGAVTATANGVHVLARRSGVALKNRDWLWWNGTTLVQIVTLAGTTAAPHISTIPVVPATVNSLFHPARVVKVRAIPGQSTTVERKRGINQAVVWQWEEFR